MLPATAIPEPAVNGTRAMAPAGMRREEYDRIKELLATYRPRACLEVGMAHGGSSVVICQALRDFGGQGRHTAVDPFQSSPQGWRGEGVESVRRAGLEDLFELVEDFDYLALPRLVEQKRRFDFILIDGWHSFDYTLLDLFYADLLLAPGGLLLVHDTGWPAVYKACRFLETHKPYDRLSPPLAVTIPGLLGRLARRAGQVLGGPAAYRQARSRRCEWFSLGAYRKRADQQVPDDFYAAF